MKELRVEVADPAELPDLNIEATPESPNPGDTVIKTITVTNATGITLTNMYVFDQLVDFRSIIPSLAPRENRVFRLQLPIPPGTLGGTDHWNIVTIPPRPDAASAATGHRRSAVAPGNIFPNSKARHLVEIQKDNSLPITKENCLYFVFIF